MSFALTTKQVRAQTKTVTRRVGWSDLKPGEQFWAVEKAQGLKKGETIRRIALLQCISNERERLDLINVRDVAREGFPELTPQQFVAMFCRNMGVKPSRIVNVIEFSYVPRS